MLSQFWTVLLLLAAFSAAQTPPSLVEALVASGAKKFADFIQSDADLLALYTSGQIKTIFAPVDSATSPAYLQARVLTPRQQQEAKYQGSKSEADLIQASQPLPGIVFETANESPKLNGKGNAVVVDNRPRNISNSTTRRQADTSLLRISSGLGNVANVIKGDVKFNGGLIHITDSYFTLPESLSSTSGSTGHTSFASLAERSNMTAALDAAHLVTVFVPSNEAFSSAPNGSTPPAELLSNHVVPDFVGYLPDLKDGAVLKTRTGGSLTISVKNNQYFVDGAKITTANLILENGVAHVVDKVLTPKTPPPVVSASALGVDMVRLPCILGMAGALALVALA